MAVPEKGDFFDFGSSFDQVQYSFPNSFRQSAQAPAPPGPPPGSAFGDTESEKRKAKSEKAKSEKRKAKKRKTTIFLIYRFYPRPHRSTLDPIGLP